MTKFTLFNTLSIRIFAFFWLSFFLLLAIIFSLPYWDARIYSNIQTNELSSYRKALTRSIRNNKISQIVSGAAVLPLDKFDGMHPVVVYENDIMGALPDEIEPIKTFMNRSTNPLTPLKKTFYDIQVAGPFMVYLSAGDEDIPYHVYFLARVNAQKEIISFIFDRPHILIFVIMLISTPILWVLSHSIGQPLKHLQSAANAIALGNFKSDKTLETNGTRELRQVGRSFNRMTEALDNIISNHQSLLSSISHELRTPLTRLQLALALLRRKNGESSETARIEKEAKRLEIMINDLLLVSRQQLHSHTLRDIFPLDELWRDVLNDAAFEAEQRHISFVVKQLIYSPGNYLINGNQGLLASALENVIRNALKYTKSHIEVTLHLDREQLFIAIDDDGEGIPETEYKNIFKPFYRIDEARTRETGGAGLGLAIAVSIVKGHQGQLSATKSHLGGLNVTFKLPLWIS
ncbi:MAG: envelope stress sensor histidine kinase CpxA [[Pasteurella] mairii]|uniref:histidine kinase n=1 Tax=[Pasteurella] mairii TaxID=757 RepID=A0A379B2B8_9PAST|nr:envelope stress sensor histidine kinase CpxA [[Pasteurella] mairii]SUB32641.1 sensor protein CpxA [[Pasteurella] mairii]